MPKNPIVNSEIGDDRDNLQIGATGTEKRVHLIKNIIKLRR